MAKHARAANLVYGFDDKIPLWSCLALSLQFMMSPTVSLVFPILLIQAVHASSQAAASLIGLSLILVAVVTVIQSLKMRYGGSGMFFPPSNAPPYLAPSLAAASVGGLPVVFTMTLFAACIQILFTWVVKRLSDYFPADIAGLVLTLISIEIAAVSLSQYPHAYLLSAHHLAPVFQWGLMLLPLLLVLALALYGNRLLRLYSMALGIIISYPILLFSGGINPQHLHTIAQAPWFFIPHLMFTHFDFRASMIIPFAIAGIVCGFKLTGCAFAIQQMQVEHLEKADMKQLGRANLIDGIGSFVAGLIGTMGINISSSVSALSVATKINARVLAYPMAACFFIAGFCPKFALIFVYMPGPIIAGILFPLGCSLLISSAKMMLRHADNQRSRMIIGVGFVLGLSQNVYPRLYEHMPHIVHLFTGSSIAIAAIFALCANAICVFIDKRRASRQKATAS